MTNKTKQSIYGALIGLAGAFIGTIIFFSLVILSAYTTDLFYNVVVRVLVMSGMSVFSLLILIIYIYLILLIINHIENKFEV